MQSLNRLLQLVQAASAVTDLTRHKHTITLPVINPAGTFYLHTDTAAVRIVRWERPHVEITIETRPPIAWRVATDYDANGVYVVVVQRLAIVNVAQAVISALVPSGLHLTLRSQGGIVSLDHVNGILNIPPVEVATGMLPDSIDDMGQ